MRNIRDEVKPVPSIVSCHAEDKVGDIIVGGGASLGVTVFVGRCSESTRAPIALEFSPALIVSHRMRA
jgi:proline racemase